MFTFFIFVVLSGLCFILYAYYSHQILLLKKQVMVLTTKNEELRTKLKKAVSQETKEQPLQEDSGSSNED